MKSATFVADLAGMPSAARLAASFGIPLFAGCDPPKNWIGFRHSKRPIGLSNAHHR